MCIGASEGALGSAALRRAATPHGPSPWLGSGPRHIRAIRYAKCQAVFQRLRSRASNRYARVRFHARDSFGKWAVSAACSDFERTYLDRPCLLHCEQAHLRSGKARTTLLRGRARHSLVTPFPTARLASGSTRMVVVKSLLLRYHPRDILFGRARHFYPGSIYLHGSSRRSLLPPGSYA